MLGGTLSKLSFAVGMVVGWRLAIKRGSVEVVVCNL